MKTDDASVYRILPDNLLKALADPGRRRLLDRLRARTGQTQSELCQRMKMTRQGFAKHLALLERAGMILTIWEGRKKLHYLNRVAIQRIFPLWIRPSNRVQCGLPRGSQEQLSAR